MLRTAVANDEKIISDLEAQVKASRRALALALIDVALVGFGATSALRQAGLPLSEKELLVAGLDLAQGQVSQVVGSLVEKLISASLIEASGSALLAKALTALTSEVVAAGGAKAAVSAVAASATQLSTTQRTASPR